MIWEGKSEKTICRDLDTIKAKKHLPSQTLLEEKENGNLVLQYAVTGAGDQGAYQKVSAVCQGDLSTIAQRGNR